MTAIRVINICLYLNIKIVFVFTGTWCNTLLLPGGVGNVPRSCLSDTANTAEEQNMLTYVNPVETKSYIAIVLLYK